MNQNTISILIVDDHPVFRQGLRDLVDTDPGMEVIGEAADSDAAMALIREEEPEIVLMDINLPTINGLQVTRQIKGELPDTKIITITGYDAPEQIFHALRAGASAYCPKDTPPDALIDIIYTVRDGKYVVDNRTMSHEEVLDWVEGQLYEMPGALASDVDDMFVPLTPRQMDVLELVTEGLTNREIGMELGISHQTVKNHLTAILRKLNCYDRTQAAVYALRRGWFRLDEVGQPEES